MGRNTSKVRNALPPYRGGATIQGLPEKCQNLLFKKTRWLVTVNQFISPPHYLVEKIRMNLAGRLTGGVPKEVGKQVGVRKNRALVSWIEGVLQATLGDHVDSFGP
jgi:hypothetical protein